MASAQCVWLVRGVNCAFDLPEDIASNLDDIRKYLPVAMATIQETSTLAVVTRIRTEDISVVPEEPGVFSKSYGNESELKISFPAGTVKSKRCLSVKLFPARELFNQRTRFNKDLLYFPVIKVSGQKEPFLKRVNVELIYRHDDVADIDDDLLPVGMEKPFVPDFGILFQSHKPDQGKKTWQSRAEDTEAKMERLENNRVKITFSVVHFCSSVSACKKRKQSPLPAVEETENFSEPSSSNFMAIILAVQDEGNLTTVVAPKTSEVEVKLNWGFNGELCQSFVTPQQQIFFCVHLQPDQQRLPLLNCFIRFMTNQITSTRNYVGKQDLAKTIMNFLSSKCESQEHDPEYFMGNVCIKSTSDRQVMSETKEKADVINHNGFENNNLPMEAEISDIGKLAISDTEWSDVNPKLFDVLLLTFSDHEFSAAREILACSKIADTGTCLGPVYYGTVGKNYVALLKWLASENEAAEFTKTYLSACMRCLRPKTIVCLGSCCGKKNVHELGDIRISSHLSRGRCLNSEDYQIKEPAPIKKYYYRLLSLFEAGKEKWKFKENGDRSPKVHFDIGPVKEKCQNFHPFASDHEGKCLICECDVPWILCESIAKWLEGGENEIYHNAPEVCASYVEHILQKFYFPGDISADRRQGCKRARDLDEGVLEEVYERLNVRSLRKNDFRKLAELMGYTKEQIELVKGHDNPAKTLLQEWATSNENTLDKLISLLRKMRRDDVVDILLKKSTKTFHRMGEGRVADPECEVQAVGDIACNYASNCTKDSSVNDLPFLEIQKIGKKLNVHSELGGDYRHLAAHFGMSNDDIARLGQLSNKTEIVLQRAGHNPRNTIAVLRGILLKMERYDCVNIVDNAVHVAFSNSDL